MLHVSVQGPPAHVQGVTSHFEMTIEESATVKDVALEAIGRLGYRPHDLISSDGSTGLVNMAIGSYPGEQQAASKRGLSSIFSRSKKNKSKNKKTNGADKGEDEAPAQLTLTSGLDLTERFSVHWQQEGQDSSSKGGSPQLLVTCFHQLVSHLDEDNEDTDGAESKER